MRKLVLFAAILLSVSSPSLTTAQQIHVPPDPETDHGNLCPRTLLGTYDVSMESLGLMAVGAALRLDNGMIVVSQKYAPNIDASWLLYLQYGSTITVQPVSISGNGYYLFSQPLGQPFEISCDVSNTEIPLTFTIETSRLHTAGT